MFDATRSYAATSSLRPAAGLAFAFSPHYLAQTADLPDAQNDNFADSGPCPICRGEAKPDRPSADFHRGHWRQRWLCCACGHHWATSRRIQD